jgi:hypothetical protein
MHNQRSVPSRHGCEASSRYVSVSLPAGPKPEPAHKGCEKLFQFWAMRFLLSRSEFLNPVSRGLRSVANPIIFMALAVFLGKWDDRLVGAATCVFIFLVFSE